MKTAILAAIAASFFLPVAAQIATQRVEQRTPPAAAPTPAKPAEKATTPRENARLAKAQNRDMKCATKDRQPRQKKATAT